MKLLLEPAFWWLPMGALAFLLALVNLFRAIAGERRGQGLLQLASLSCALLAVLSMFYLTAGWVEDGDWSALMDCVPAMTKLLTAAVAVGLALHLAAFVIGNRRDARET